MHPRRKRCQLKCPVEEAADSEGEEEDSVEEVLEVEVSEVDLEVEVFVHTVVVRAEDHSDGQVPDE